MHSVSRSFWGVKASDCVGASLWEGGEACVSPFECPRGRAFERDLTVEMDMSAYPQMKKFKPLLRHIPRHSVAIAVIMSCIKIYTTYKHEEGMIV